MAILTSKGCKIPTLILPSDRKYLQANGITANVVHHDLDLYFKGHEFWNVNISKTVRASKKYSRMTFIEVDICHRIWLLRMLNSMTLTWIFMVKLFTQLFWRGWKKQTLLLPWDRKSCICLSYGAIANDVHHDLDFQGHHIWNVNILKMTRASKKCYVRTFIDIDVCHRLGLLQML